MATITNDHPVTIHADVALRAAFDRAKGASNYWVQVRDALAPSGWDTWQHGTDRMDAATRFASLAADGREVLFGADDAEHIIVCTSPAYEAWARPRH